jgi:hypothetical protein
MTTIKPFGIIIVKDVLKHNKTTLKQIIKNKKSKS